ncbi:MAG: aminotransferase [Methylacidiphilales bacterium]|nr:aminotransferase [Candidatus Methylacidiphilales bacterium]
MQKTSVLYPSTNFKHLEKFVVSHGKGVYLYDIEGKEYLEAMSGLWCLSLGYGNEELTEAANAQMRKLSYSNPFGGKSHTGMIELANQLAEMLPIPEAKIFFGLSGSDANDTHIKILRYYANVTGQSKKKKILAGSKAYHGVGVGSVALTGLAGNHTHFDVPFESIGVVRFPTPHYYRMGQQGESVIAFEQRMANELEALIVKEDPETIMAYISEPLIGAGGVVLPGKHYFAEVQKILKKHNILFIDDEVITGFGRTGEDFGATTFGLRPDCMTLAKALTSGYQPLSAAVIPNFIYEAMIEASDQVGVFGHGFTYSGHPVSCAVALAALKIYKRDQLFNRAKKIGELIQKKLAKFEDHALVGEVRGIGMIGALELVANKKTKADFPKEVKIGLLAQQHCQEEGLIVRGVAGNSVAICPPLIMSEPEIELLFDRLSKGLDKTLHAVKQYMQ